MADPADRAETASARRNTPARLTALIVGAGPTGLVLACELARHGVSFRLIEATAGAQLGSRGKGLQPRSLEVLDDLGIGPLIRSSGWLGMPIRSVAVDGSVSWGGAIPECLQNRPDIPYPASLITPQWRVEEALRTRLTELGGTVEFGTALEGFEQSDDAVHARVVSRGVAGTIDAQWLIGCDGGHSIVRKHAGMAFDGETRENVRMVVADVKVDGLDRDGWTMWHHPEGMVTLCPLPSTDTFCYQALVAEGEDPRSDLASMQSTLERRSGRRDIRLYDPQWSSLWRANVRIVDHYRAGRALLAGDAAHIHSPAGGQGMNTGIQDAYNLGWKLAAVDHGASPALIDSYQDERRPVAAGVLTLSDTRLRQALAQQDIRRDASTIQLDVNYRGSSLSSDDRPADAPVRAGDRAPDATMIRTADGVHRLFDLIGGGIFTLLNFTGTAAAIDSVAPPILDRPSSGGRATSLRTGQIGARLRTLDIVDHPTVGQQIADDGGHLSTAYQPTEHTLVLIRPDGYIGLISDVGDVSAVTAYLDQISRASAVGV